MCIRDSGALAALSGPVKGPNGEPDERPATRRRADALVEIVRRGVSCPGEAPKSEKAQVVVTIGLEDLRSGTDGAGVTATGQVLAPSVIRRLACDAGIIPAILGRDGEVLDAESRSRESAGQVCSRRYLPKCGTVNAIRPRSPE